MSDMEAMFRGDKGERGERGTPGVPGLPRETRRAIVWLFLFALAVGGLNLWWTSHTAARVTRAVTVNAAQRCASIAEIVRIPIPVPTADNPSREAWAEYEGVQRHRGHQLGCKLPPPRYAPSPPGH